MAGIVIGWLLLTVLIASLVVWLVGAYARPRTSDDHAGTARRILADRFARGELDTDEYQQRLAVLK